MKIHLIDIFLCLLISGVGATVLFIRAKIVWRTLEKTPWLLIGSKSEARGAIFVYRFFGCVMTMCAAFFLVMLVAETMGW